MADLIYRRDAYDVVYKEHCGICTGAILDIPKVEAIPIEWIEEKIKYMKQDCESDAREVIQSLVYWWRAEQKGWR